jgi:hypothetical protein
MVVYIDSIVVSVGASAGSKVDITAIERFIISEVTNVGDKIKKPIVVMGTINPIGWRQGHKWIEGELHVKSEAITAFTTYVTSTTAHVTVPYFVAVIKDSAAGTKTYTFTGAFFVQPELTVAHEEDGVSIYRFVANSVAIT